MKTYTDLDKALGLSLYPHKLTLSYSATPLSETAAQDTKIAALLTDFIQAEEAGLAWKLAGKNAEADELIAVICTKAQQAEQDFTGNFHSVGKDESRYALPDGGEAVLSILPFAYGP